MRKSAFYMNELKVFSPSARAHTLFDVDMQATTRATDYSNSARSRKHHVGGGFLPGGLHLQRGSTAGVNNRMMKARGSVIEMAGKGRPQTQRGNVVDIEDGNKAGGVITKN